MGSAAPEMNVEVHRFTLRTGLFPFPLAPIKIPDSHNFENRAHLMVIEWSGREDLNLRPQRPERCALPG